MHYLSTRRQAPMLALGPALIAGLAPDGGLYVPERLPRLDLHDFADCDSLPEVAARLLHPFFLDDPLAADLQAICDEALNFPTPMQSLNHNSWLLELFHGPTAAFKDIGARFLAACLQRLRPDSDRPLTIVVATSGDTGAAVAAAFHRRPGFRVVILYPDGRVSPRQAHQLGCFGDNVRALRVAGTFDDCQALVKRALNDEALKRDVPLTSANSISLGRLLPQMSYYALAALQHWREHRRTLDVVIPTGNLGNALGCIFARRIGMPIGSVSLASNANPVLPLFFHGEDFVPRASIATLANAMDVGNPSNFERLRWLYADEDALRAAFRSESIDDAAIRTTLLQVLEQTGQVVCPHTATGMHLLQTLRSEGSREHTAVVATAHPAKFDSVIEPLIGREIPVPDTLGQLLQRPANAEPIPADYQMLEDRLRM